MNNPWPEQAMHTATLVGIATAAFTVAYLLCGIRPEGVFTDELNPDTWTLATYCNNITRAGLTISGAIAGAAIFGRRVLKH